ncbi:hydrogenase maturation nickel metallochaperone HypA [Corynebacterium aquilae]|uniref:Hydrogenase maturation factor HypA n=1 Tax=Corynebacterium aquilae DSM 44791 TaxID=1431546 RepID=A0A1L7CDV6_9CORY|nr:hydrogenase maturation nickel metallochaperone HypA [Corynebacterium aquilae]APT84026.1 hypothetical protein CAQU_01885 [Corynebacterium aquilae DSM 44791]
MHEVALSQQLAGAVARAASGRRVLSVNLRIGALRQVVPESLAHAWTFTTSGTPLAGSALEVEWMDAVMTCACGFSGVISGEFSALCPECDAIGTIEQGNEFQLVSIDVDSADNS